MGSKDRASCQVGRQLHPGTGPQKLPRVRVCAGCRVGEPPWTVRPVSLRSHGLTTVVAWGAHLGTREQCVGTPLCCIPSQLLALWVGPWCHQRGGMQAAESTGTQSSLGTDTR